MAISTSSQTMDAPGLLTRITKRSSAFLKLKPTQPCWPDAEDSTGSFYDTVDGEKYWNLKDQNCSAFLKFAHLSKKLASILKKHTEAPTVLARWKAYMIGESAPLCALGILFCCGDTEYLKTAASYISASGAVDESSGVIVKFRSSLPKYKGTLIHLGLGRQEVDFIPGGPGPRDHTPSAGNRSTEHSHSSTLIALGYSPQCFTASEDVSPGDAVYVEMVDGIQTATIGGRIECGDQELFITAAHPFTHQRSGAKEKAANGKERLPTSLKDAGCLYYSSCFNKRPELDYALIQPRGEVSMIDGPSLQSSDSMFAFPVFTSEEDFRNLVETNVRTSSASAAVMLGELDTIPEFLEIPGATGLQEVYAAHFESVLAPGDSGSWVYNAERDILHGHIVAGVPEDGLALIIPAHLVFADLLKTFASTPVKSPKEALVSHIQEKPRPTYTPADLTDQNPPCNTLWVGNLSMDTSEDELKAVFSSQRGYKRLCFRTKQNRPMCFVEFEDTSQATEALYELHGYKLHGSNESGIRLSFSKNPLGVRRISQAESVDVTGRKEFEVEISQKDAETRPVSNSRDPILPLMETTVASPLSSTSQRFENNVQHSQQASRGISHPENDILSGPPSWYHSDEYITPNTGTDAMIENILEGHPTRPVFESREQPLQQFPPADYRAETSFTADIERITAGLSTGSVSESREQPLQQFQVGFAYRLERAETSFDASTNIPPHQLSEV